MEVHQHAHTERKKWTHYLWEFLMLFFAVFCGFLAEYYLEQTIEHHREKQFMKSLVEDLAIDTAEIKRRIAQVDLTKKFSDSAIAFLNSYKPSSEITTHFDDQLRVAQQRLSLINTDRTSTQLKNSGGMRLIRNKKVVDHLLDYWKQVEESQNSLNRYLMIRNEGRELSFKLYRIAISYSDSLHLNDNNSLDVIDPDPQKWNELTNLIAISRQIVKGEHSTNLHHQYESAIELIKIIKEGYYIK